MYSLIQPLISEVVLMRTRGHEIRTTEAAYAGATQNHPIALQLWQSISHY